MRNWPGCCAPVNSPPSGYRAHETIGYLVRAHWQAKQELFSAKNTLKSVLLRHDRRYPGRTLWGRLHRRFRIGALLLRTGSSSMRRTGPHPSTGGALCATGQILGETVSDWPLSPAVTPLHALWRIKLTVVVTFAAEICTGSTVTSN